MDQQSEADFKTTERGARCVVDKKYIYLKQKELAGGKQSWECERRKMGGCKAKIHVFETMVQKEVNEHNHLPESHREEIMAVRSSLKRRAEETEEPPQRLLSTALSGLSQGAATQMTSVAHVRRAIRRNR